MKRRALIIYCDNTASGELTGPSWDYYNYNNFLCSKLGGDWNSSEILPLHNPISIQVINAKNKFLINSDYTFIIFSGHGFLNEDDNNRQYIELSDKSIPLRNLFTNSKRQTIIVDACRGYYSPTEEMLKLKTFSGFDESLIGDISSTRGIFDKAIMLAEEGLTILYAASKNQSALDTNKGGAYLLSLLGTAELWKEKDNKNNILSLKDTHDYAIKYLSNHFDTIQIPTMNREKRLRHFPFAVKKTILHG